MFCSVTLLCLNLIIMITSDVITATCFDLCRSSSGYYKRIFLVSFFYFYCGFIILLDMFWRLFLGDSLYCFELSAGLLLLCSCVTLVVDVVWVCQNCSVLSS
jgi:hypothetical protein